MAVGCKENPVSKSIDESPVALMVYLLSLPTVILYLPDRKPEIILYSIQ